MTAVARAGDRVATPNPAEARPRDPMSAPARPRWALPALFTVAALAGLSYTWGIAHQSLEIYYEAAVRSMGTSWHDFLFGSFDPAGTISVDKLPGALWVQALSVRIFGFHVWAIVAPQVLEGVLTVLVLYRAVNRVAGPVAGIVAAVVVAVSPATVALDRGNISDSLLILLLVLAADATVSALTTAKVRWLALAGFWVGLAFQAKMLQAWLVLPALGTVWIMAAPSRLTRRVVQFGAATLVALVVSLSWMSVVSLVPHGERPYVDGSSDDSLFQQVFEYNGFTRVGSDVGGSRPNDTTSAFAALSDFRLPAGPGPLRLLGGAGGRDIGWLMPAAAASGVVVLVARRRRPRGDVLRAAVVLWALWLVIDLVAFSAISGINAYYLAALTPAIGALCGIGVEVVRRSGVGARGAVTIGFGLVAATIAYGVWLTGPASWGLRAPLLVAGAALLGLAAWMALGGRGVAGTAVGAGRWSSRLAVGSVLALASLAVFPLAAAVAIVVDGLGPFDTPYQPAAVTHITQVEPAEALSALRAQLPLLTRVNKTDRYVAATYTSIIAAPLIIDSGKEFEPIGGFTGRTPSPTVDALQAQVDSGQLQTIISPAVEDSRIDWVVAHCLAVPTRPNAATRASPIVGIRVYFCSPRR
jgi:4-amino-4-deoxy-L-arabinose transferase-like glycosyltransferase